ncbi:hypothetical protein J6590_073192 [Homalodisca vitripennis]|nr:hypothetical protein J6590_073192 [Homalodisca vitripennis]
MTMMLVELDLLNTVSIFPLYLLLGLARQEAVSTKNLPYHEYPVTSDTIANASAGYVKRAGDRGGEGANQLGHRGVWGV